jgi:hypothetical protein
MQRIPEGQLPAGPHASAPEPSFGEKVHAPSASAATHTSPRIGITM